MFENESNGRNSSTMNNEMDNNRPIPFIQQSPIVKPTRRKEVLSKIHFIVCCIGYSVGLGNIWRFPYLAMIHGGGSFLIAYLVMTVFVGAPLFVLELAMGQYAGKSPVIFFANMFPVFSGVGLAMLTVTALVMIYYSVILAWILIYIFSSFSKVLPWSFCDTSWCSSECFSADQYAECARQNKTLFNGTCFLTSNLCQMFGYKFSNATHCYGPLNSSSLNYSTINDLPLHRIPSAVDYYTNHVLDMSNGIDDIGSIKWQLVIALLIAWVLVFVCLFRSSYTSGKLIYFTALFPWLLLIILLIKSVTLDGAINGILFFFTPQLRRLLEAEIWGDAAVQVLFSLGTTFGVLISLSTNNPFYNNCIRDGVVVVICDTLSSFVAGVAVFAVLGSMAIDLNVSVDKIVPSGLEVTFITIPEAVTSFVMPPFWAVLFFAMLLTLGLDSQYTAVASIQIAIEDFLPKLKSYPIHVLGGICCVGFVLGLPMTTEAGIFIFKLFDKYAIAWSLLIIGILECVIVMWLYGRCSDNANGFAEHIEDMIGREVSGFWMACWKLFIPVGLSILLLSQWLSDNGLQFGHYKFPNWANAVGYLLSMLSVVIIPVVAVYHVIKMQRHKKDAKVLFYPTELWGPSCQFKENNGCTGKLFHNPLNVHKLGCHRMS
ncbi:solute carrier 6 (neurotransmitter transporter) [Chamberlinius hualienensis]